MYDVLLEGPRVRIPYLLDRELPLQIMWDQGGQRPCLNRVDVGVRPRPKSIKDSGEERILGDELGSPKIWVRGFWQQCLKALLDKVVGLEELTVSKAVRFIQVVCV